jgi:hypothetical protein
MQGTFAGALAFSRISEDEGAWLVHEGQAGSGLETSAASAGSLYP